MQNRYSTAADRYRTEVNNVMSNQQSQDNSMTSTTQEFGTGSLKFNTKFTTKDEVASLPNKHSFKVAEGSNSQHTSVMHKSPGVHKLGDLSSHSKFKQSPYSKKKLMTTSIIYKGYAGSFAKDHDPLDLKEDAILARNALHAPAPTK